ncbi:hypothetical protein Acsp05_47670 [Actinokineospora sp. NBRC 105648]|nr:hypothetical protein Acsp05_47670 [Actinokineospora sp. NBRC 105648]
MGKSHSAPATAPAVPNTVMALGVRRKRTSHAPIGSVTRETEARAKMFSMGLWNAPNGRDDLARAA